MSSPQQIYGLFHFGYGEDGETEKVVCASRLKTNLLHDYHGQDDIATNPCLWGIHEHEKAQSSEICHYCIMSIRTV